MPFDLPGHTPGLQRDRPRPQRGRSWSRHVDALEAQGLIVEQAINEYGPGQQEISIRHADALRRGRQPDEVPRHRARRRRSGTACSPRSRPSRFPTQIGSGAHVHFSRCGTATGARSLLYDAARRRGLSRARAGTSSPGVTEHLPALVALTTPELQLLPPAGAQRLGVGDHGLGLRQQGGRRCGSARRSTSARSRATTSSSRPSDASANPYLSLGALIAAGLDGIERAAGARRALRARPGPDERTAELARGARSGRCRRSMAAALDELEKDQLLLDSMGDLLARCYLAVRRSEDEAFRAQDQEFEIRNHFYRF